MGPTPTEEIIPPHHYVSLQISRFSLRIKEISVLYFYVLQTSYHQIQTSWI